MKTALIANIILFFFTCFVLLTDGFPGEAAYIFFTVWILLTLILSSYVMSRDLSSLSAVLKLVAIISNIVFLAFVFWALADQPAHPEEYGFITFVVLMVLTPVLNLIVLFYTSKDIWRTLHLQSKTS